MYNVLCLEKPKKEQDEYSNFYKNFCGTDIKLRLTDIDENRKKNLSMVMDLLAVFFSIHFFMKPTKW